MNLRIIKDNQEIFLEDVEFMEITDDLSTKLSPEDEEIEIPPFIKQKLKKMEGLDKKF